MRKRTRITFLLIIFAFTMATCSATVNQPTLPQTDLPPVYLPFVLKNSSSSSIFGIDGKNSLDKMNAAGASWLRLNQQLHWSEVESTEGVYDWSKAANVENRLIDAANNGMNVILLVQNSPQWARKYPNSACGPILKEKYAAFGNFLNQVVQRYSKTPYNVKYFQIWNEPDGGLNDTDIAFGCWAEFTDETYGGRNYGEMLAQVYPNIKAADPKAQLVMGSLMMVCDAQDPNPEGTCAEEAHRRMAKFFDGVLQTARGSFDIVMFNSGPSYDRGQNPVWGEINNWRWKKERGGLVIGKINYLRKTMAKYGIDRPIIHSEAYLLDRPDDASQFELFEDYKADYLVWVYANGWSQKLKTVVWYSIEGWKGSELIRNGTEETKAYKALKTMTGFIKTSEFISRVDYPAGFTRFIFRGNGEDIWLLIPTGKIFGTRYEISKPADFKRAVNMIGQVQNVTGITISFNHPIYVIVNQ